MHLAYHLKVNYAESTKLFADFVKNYFRFSSQARTLYDAKAC